MKIIFMGTPEFAVAALNSIIEAGYEVVAVYTKEPKPAGRGQKEQKSPVHLTAEKHNIPVKTPKTLKTAEAQAEFADLHPDIAVVAAYGLILPQAILDVCKCINIHASLLPRWRGAAPIQRAILAGDKQTGVTIMQMDAGLDTGDMILAEGFDIDRMNCGEVHDKLSIIGADLVVKVLNSNIKPVVQPEGATYADKIKKEEAKINWSNTAEQIDRQIRAFAPHPGAYFTYNNEIFKILSAGVEANKSIENQGVILDSSFGMSCSDGVIHPQIIQRQGKKAMSVEELLRGFSVTVGERVL
jgi:methionyl-tRNA formyltransferase